MSSLFARLWQKAIGTYQEPSRLEVLAAIWALPVIRPAKPPKPSINLLCYRDARRKVRQAA